MCMIHIHIRTPALLKKPWDQELNGNEDMTKTVAVVVNCDHRITFPRDGPGIWKFPTKNHHAFVERGCLV